MAAELAAGKGGRRMWICFCITGDKVLPHLMSRTAWAWAMYTQVSA